MRTVLAILTAALAIFLAGCVIQGKPKAASPPAPQPAAAAPAPAPPPPPLSMPQTEIVLPPAQPVDPQALTKETPPETPAENPSPGRNQRRPAPPAATHSEPAATPPTPPPLPEVERGPVRELLDPAEIKRLKANADLRRREVRSWLNTNRARRLGPKNPTVIRIQGYLKVSEDAEEKEDVRGASEWAERAALLMKELQSGK